jgi:hypothetical protein
MWVLVYAMGMSVQVYWMGEEGTTVRINKFHCPCQPGASAVSGAVHKYSVALQLQILGPVDPYEKQAEVTFVTCALLVELLADLPALSASMA